MTYEVKYMEENVCKLEKDNIGLSGRIKLLRLGNKLTGQGLADKLGVSKSTISQWEKGRTIPSHQNLSKLSKIFKVSSDYLLSGSETVPYFMEGDLLNTLNAEIKIKQIKDLFLAYWKDSTDEDKMAFASLIAKNSEIYERKLVATIILMGLGSIEELDTPLDFIFRGEKV